MRKWSVVLAMSALVALPLCAQEQKNDVASESAKAAALAAAKSGSPAAKAEPAARNAWGFSGAVRTTPLATAANANSSNEDEPGRTTPKWEASVGYSYTSFHPGVPFDDLSLHGASGGFVFNVHKYLGLVVDFGGGRFSRRLSPTTRLNGGVFTYLFGPRLNLRRFDRFVPFAEFLVGGARSGGALTGTSNSGYDSFAVATGGGVDVVLTRNLAWRFAQIDFLMTNFSGPTVGGNSRQDNLRLGSGLVFRFGNEKRVPPPPPNRSPVASCSASPSSVYAGSGDAVTVHVNASDPDNDALTYSYTATGGTVEGSGPDARWNTAGLGVGVYTANAKVDDGKGGNATCAADIKVEQRPNRPPVISCSTERSPIQAGERTAITSTASDPDNDPLTYSYTATGGQVTGSGAQVQFDATGLPAGNYTVKCMASDGRGGNAESSTTVEVKEPLIKKQLELKLALHSIYFQTALPTVAKPDAGLLASQAATLDTLARDFKQYLTYRADAHLILEGHADIRGAQDYNQALSERRVARTKNYLIEKGVPADHIESKGFGAQRNMTSEEVKRLLEEDPDLTPAEKQKLLKNLLTVRLANNRRVDVTLSTTGEQSTRRFPFNAKDALTLISRSGGGTRTTKVPAAKKPAPKR